MNYRTLGRTGVQVSTLCLGTMTFGNEAEEQAARSIFHSCLDAGINFIDTANAYSKGRAEEILGRLMKGCRDRLVVGSKFQAKVGEDLNDRGCSRRHIRQAVEASLRRLQTDYLDLYFIHNFDPLTPLEETLRALDDLVHQGKILYPAISNSAAWQIMKGLAISVRENLAGFACIQPMYSLVKRQAEVEILPLAQSEQLGVISYSPLAAGLLTGKYSAPKGPARGRIDENKFYQARYDEQEYYETAEKFAAFCRSRNWNPAATAIAWVTSHPAITAAIIGARNPEQMKEALATLQLAMTPELRSEISQFSKTPPLATDRRDEQLGLKIH